MKSLSYMLAFTILVLASCKKNNDPKPPASNPPAEKSVLAIKLEPQYLGSAKIDSAFATWKKGDFEKRITLEVRNDSLLADIAVFDEGQGQLTITAFSNLKLRNQYYMHYVFKKNITVEKTKSINYAGPQTFFDPAWFPRVDLKDGIGHRAIFGLRPDDSYFWVKKSTEPFYQLVVAKEYWKTVGGIQQIGGGEWKCSNGCWNSNGNTENTNYFDFIPGQIGTKTWNHISLTVLWETDVNGGWAISLEYPM